MPTFTRYFVLLTILALVSCRQSILRPFEKEIVSAVSQIELDSLDIQKNATEQSPTAVFDQEVRHLYALNNYKSVWFDNNALNPLGAALVQQIENAFELGLNPENYNLPIVDQLQVDDAQAIAKCDVQLTVNAVQLFSHAAYGVVRTKEIFTHQEHAFFRFKVMEGLRLAIETGLLDSALAHVQPHFLQYTKLSELAKQFSFPDYRMQVYPFIKMPPLNDAALVSVFNLIGYDINRDELTTHNRSLLISSFQKQEKIKVTGNENFETFAQLCARCNQKFRLLDINMERMRQNPPLLNNYVWVNIPSFRLQLTFNDKVVHSTRIVVGAPKTPTPILSSKLSHVITYPQWNIPTSIIQKEIMPAMARDSNYLAKKGYKVTTWTGGNLPDNTVLKHSSSANNLPFNISQPPGNDNALGTLKFLFDNSESVYLHDTNSKSFFAKNFRALSHGCIRVQDPHKLATFLLDTAAVTRMDKQLANKQSGHIPITKEIGVYLRYVTCGVNDKGRLEAYNDIYMYDEADRRKMTEGLNWKLDPY
jgi:murein L,D-transpeptidase YcbB/YkuD